MKKVYSKPEIIFEDFALSTNIAGPCEYRVNISDNACGVKFGKDVIFITGVTGCKEIVVEGSTLYDELCYHNPYESNNAFAS